MRGGKPRNSEFKYVASPWVPTETELFVLKGVWLIPQEGPAEAAAMGGLVSRPQWEDAPWDSWSRLQKSLESASGSSTRTAISATPRNLVRKAEGAS